jgi:hypothetical protein
MTEQSRADICDHCGDNHARPIHDVDYLKR